MQTPTKPECQAPPEGGAVVAGAVDGCGHWFDVGDDGNVVVRDLAGGPEVSGALPFPLSRADFEPVASPHGLVLMVAEQAPESDVPLSVGALYVAGETLEFVMLWDRRLGDDSTGDGTSLGPPYGLAVVTCDSGLGFVAAPRLPSATAEEPSEAIAGRVGLYGAGGRVGDLPEDCSAPLAAPL